MKTKTKTKLKPGDFVQFDGWRHIEPYVGILNKNFSIDKLVSDDDSYRVIPTALVFNPNGSVYSYVSWKEMPRLKKITEKQAMAFVDEELETANFEVTETWTVSCPHCYQDQMAPFNAANPMQPMKINCEGCDKRFILTYERD